MIFQIPLYGGMQISFVNPPYMNFKIVGTGSGIAQTPMLVKKVQATIKKLFSSLFVLPNSMFIRTVPVEKLDLAALKFQPPPMWCVRIEILEMRHLPAADVGSRYWIWRCVISPRRM